jgi:hypothetical protein
MKDSRGEKADKNDQTEYPCVRCSSIIDAPMEDVCMYLSQESAAPDYNDLVVKYKNVEDISPSAKICASWTPQILFIKQREFITLCHHRWKRDGSEIIVNQAWDHEDYPASGDEKGEKACRAYALRGANSKFHLVGKEFLSPSMTRSTCALYSDFEMSRRPGEDITHYDCTCESWWERTCMGL